VRAGGVLQGVLALLAAYHLAIGLASVFSFGLTGYATQALYGVSLGDDGEAAGVRFRYSVRMLGLYALALGTLLVVAARDPLGHTDIIDVVATLQLARAVCRVIYRRDLAIAFGVPPHRNWINVALLVAEAVALVAAELITLGNAFPAFDG
jgi:hypothetical protein